MNFIWDTADRRPCRYAGYEEGKRDQLGDQERSAGRSREAPALWIMRTEGWF
ncbi:MAG: hypothetical protein KHY46_01470 [Clostridiales bacterium]|nr:hypothetical protein [Clostridiales bacterium]